MTYSDGEWLINKIKALRSEIDRLKAELEAERAKTALLQPLTDEEAQKVYEEAPNIPLSPERIEEIVRHATLGDADPDAPLRFRFSDRDAWGSVCVRHGCYFPTQNLWVSDYGTAKFGGPQFPGVEWLDPPPTEPSDPGQPEHPLYMPASVNPTRWESVS